MQCLRMVTILRSTRALFSEGLKLSVRPFLLR